MIIIQPIGGLCNRMRAINSARVLAKKRGETLKVIWNVNPELGCPFEELFQKTRLQFPSMLTISPLSAIPFTDVIYMDAAFAFSLRNIHSKWDPQKVFYQLTRMVVGNEELRANRTEQGLPDAYVASLPKNLYIATEEHFFPCHDYSPFQPTTEIADRVNAITAGFKSHNVGIHIRRTDNKPAIGKSSTQAFIDAMQKELSMDPSTMFYLATDDLSEEANLRRVFPDRIISNETRDLSRDSVNGVKDALLDLMCLSKTDKIIGSYFSSFTDIAADINGIPKIVAGEES